MCTVLSAGPAVGIARPAAMLWRRLTMQDDEWKRKVWEISTLGKKSDEEIFGLGRLGKRLVPSSWGEDTQVLIASATKDLSAGRKHQRIVMLLGRKSAACRGLGLELKRSCNRLPVVEISSGKHKYHTAEACDGFFFFSDRARASYNLSKTPLARL